MLWINLRHVTTSCQCLFHLFISQSGGCRILFVNVYILVSRRKRDTRMYVCRKQRHSGLLTERFEAICVLSVVHLVSSDFIWINEINNNSHMRHIAFCLSLRSYYSNVLHRGSTASREQRKHGRTLKELCPKCFCWFNVKSSDQCHICLLTLSAECLLSNLLKSQINTVRHFKDHSFLTWAVAVLLFCFLGWFIWILLVLVLVSSSIS